MGFIKQLGTAGATLYNMLKHVIQVVPPSYKLVKNHSKYIIDISTINQFVKLEL